MSRGLRAGATEPSVLIPFRATGGGVSAGLEGAKASVLSFGQLATCAAIPGSMSLFSMAAAKLFTAAELRRWPGSMFWGLLFRRRSSFIDGCSAGATRMIRTLRGVISGIGRGG